MQHSNQVNQSIFFTVLIYWGPTGVLLGSYWGPTDTGSVNNVTQIFLLRHIACVLVHHMTQVRQCCLQFLAPHEETSVLTQLAELPDAAQIDGAVGQFSPYCPLSNSHHHVCRACVGAST